MNELRNIIFDFGNVLVQWHPERVYGEYFGDEAKAWWFLRHVADNEWRLRIDAGESQEACISELQGRYPEYRDAIALYHSHWREMLTDEVPGMRAVVEGLLAKGYGVYGLTNWSMETFPEARRRFSILQLIDRYVVSGAEGLVKPDPRLFRVLLDRYGLRADECLFVDDNPDNVAAAQSLGMTAHLFTSADKLLEALGEPSKL